jgi:hypothetical protein
LCVEALFSVAPILGLLDSPRAVLVDGQAILAVCSPSSRRLEKDWPHLHVHAGIAVDSPQEEPLGEEGEVEERVEDFVLRCGW